MVTTFYTIPTHYLYTIYTTYLKYLHTIYTHAYCPGNPAPLITWRREGGLLPSGDTASTGPSVHISECNSNLNLHLCVPSGRVTRDHDGVYTCTAHNGVGGSQGAAANISLTV